MKDALFQKIRAKCRAEIEDFFYFADRKLCKNDEQLSKAFSDSSVKITDGVALYHDAEMQRKTLHMARAVVEAAGSTAVSIDDIIEAGYKAFASVSQKLEETDKEFKGRQDEFYVELYRLAFVPFDVIAPCEQFRFEGVEHELRSKYVSILPSENILEEKPLPTQGKNWALVEDPSGHWPEKGTFLLNQGAMIGGDVWWIKSQAPKDIAESTAIWMAQIFLSAFRVGLSQPDFCHRPKIGQSEGHPFDPKISHDRRIIFNSETSYFGGTRRLRDYKVDKKLRSQFMGEDFQGKLECVLNPAEGKLSEALSNSLGWYARGRQSLDPPERLLHFFTALESLLSRKDSAPVIETISRLLSVIIAGSIKSRLGIYKETKKLYGLRSNLVHKGHRTIHSLNANNNEHYCEVALWVVWHNVEFSIDHQEFLSSLQDASHGGVWKYEPIP